MAYTFTAAASTVFGDQRVVTGVLTADAASGVVSFGLSRLTGVQIAPKSMATVGARFRLNALAAATSSVGDLGASGLASGDEVYVTVYGK